MPNLKRLCLIAEGLCVAGFVFLVAEQFLAVDEALAYGTGLTLSVETAAASRDAGVGGWLARMPLFLSVAASLWFARSIFAHFRRGEILTDGSVRSLKRLAAAALVTPLAHLAIPVFGALPGLFGTGQYDIVVEATEMHLVFFLLSFLFFALSAVLAEAKARASDYELIF